MLETILLLSPLLAAIVAGPGQFLFDARSAMGAGLALTGLAVAISVALFLSFDGFTRVTPLFLWLESGSFSADWALRIDRISLVLAVLSCVAALFARSLIWVQASPDDDSQESERAFHFSALSLMLSVSYTHLTLPTIA